MKGVSDREIESFSLTCWMVGNTGIWYWPGSVTSIFVTGIRTTPLQGQKQFYFYSLLEPWQPCYNLIPDACILGGGTVTLAQRIQNGSKKILQVLILLLTFCWSLVLKKDWLHWLFPFVSLSFLYFVYHCEESCSYGCRNWKQSFVSLIKAQEWKFVDGYLGLPLLSLGWQLFVLH